MPPSRLAPLALALALALGAATGCGDVSPGLRVGDRTVSHDRLLGEVGEWARNPALEGQFPARSGAARGSFSTELSSAVVRFRIERELVNAEFARRGMELRDAHREQARDALFGDPALGVEEGFSESYAGELLGDAARQLALIDVLGEPAYFQWIAEAVAEERIEVSSRFGRWDPDQQLVVAPRQPTTTTTTTAITAPPLQPGQATGAETAP